MKIILLGKGKSIGKLNKDFILSHDYIAWANIHDGDKYDYLIGEYFINNYCWVIIKLNFHSLFSLN